MCRVQLSSCESEVEPGEDEIVPEDEQDVQVLQELLEGEPWDQEGDVGNKDSDTEMTNASDDSSEEEDDYNNLNYDPSQDHQG